MTFLEPIYSKMLLKKKYLLENSTYVEKKVCPIISFSNEDMAYESFEVPDRAPILLLRRIAVTILAINTSVLKLGGYIFFLFFSYFQYLQNTPYLQNINCHVIVCLIDLEKDY